MAYELKHKTNKKILNGRFYPLGAALEKDGVNFAIYSHCAKEVYLLLFDMPDKPPSDIIKLDICHRNIWHVFVQGIKAGQLYAYKIKGDYNPRKGLRFNENKLLIDPYAKALTGEAKNIDNLLFAYDVSSPDKDLSFDSRDNTYIVPKCIVIDDNDFDWQNDKSADIWLDELVIYETHLKGFTAHPSSGVKYPGTYLGFIEKIPYLKDLGINAVELLPVHQSYSHDFLVRGGLVNYWGYDTLCYFAPQILYSTQTASGCQVNEFKTLVRQLHKAGIEVIIDVVFNHTCEGKEIGPTLSFKGIDNPTYYYLTGSKDEPLRLYTDYTGCGNSLNASNAPVLRLIMDSLRYWVQVMHVDGFRFDLASVLGKENGEFLKTSSFFDAVSQDPVLSRVKLIAEPWDIGAYEVGNFPVDWSEWNGRFRDTIRKFGKGDSGQLKDLARRIFGSRDIYKNDGKSPFNSINFVTCHDGFTLYDLVSYNNKHNEANLENNKEGTDYNNSWNCGVEGETNNSNIINLRKQLMKNYATCLLLSGGIPMICGGDEIGRTQLGNNNAYCQDNEISWLNWEFLKKNKDIQRFFKKTIHATKEFKASRSGTRHTYGSFLPPSVKWYGADLDLPNWSNPEARLLCFELSEKNSNNVLIGFFAILNADYKTTWVKLPPLNDGKKWYRVIDTALPSPYDFADKEVLIDPADYYIANPRSVVFLTSG